ncbi:MAG: hypothetical protein SLAVMIC_00052 [uncultured marine phage]|uniref:Uncharacterized protein n=1 Tax=uncultured marine phage TaxID=707152 RepID=A0A8D9CCD2_9VIRU|nr:MAG: hypothetical protein SLAVMIC_00052 [uncultured marine phage]
MRKFKSGDHVICSWRNKDGHEGVVLERYFNDNDYVLVMATSGIDKNHELLYKDENLKMDVQWYREKRLKELLDGL